MQNPAYGLCSQGVNGVNSDVVMILHLNPANHTVSILSIPRTFSSPMPVPMARTNRRRAVPGSGSAIAAIEEDLGYRFSTLSS